MAAFLMLLGIYNSAILVSANNELRKSIYRHAVESRLLRLIGHAEMESEIEKTVRKISKDKNILQIDMEQRQLLEIDEKGLKIYLDLVIREVKKVDENNHQVIPTAYKYMIFVYSSNKFFQSYYLTTFSRHTKKSPGNTENSTISPTAHFMFKLPSAGYKIIVVYPEGKDQ